MNGITVPMAIVDFIPVALFFAAAVILQRDLYNKMVKGAFALLASGSILVLIGGIYKAGWKIIYALGIADIQAMNLAFFPMQGPGFLLVFLALAGMFTGYNQGAVRVHSAAVIPVFSSSLPFVLMQTVGCGGAQAMLFHMSRKMKKPAASVLFALAFVCMLAMGYLSSQFDDSSAMNWVAQCVNIVSQGSFLLGVLMLHWAGLDKKEVFTCA